MSAFEKTLARVPERNGELPVLAKLSGGVVHLGYAASHTEAEWVGLLARVSCGKISRATVRNGTRIFYVLH